MKGVSLCIYVRSTPPSIVCQSFLSEGSVSRKAGVVLHFNLVSWMVAMCISYSMTCLSFCCLFYMQSIFSCSVLSVVFIMLLSSLCSVLFDW